MARRFRSSRSRGSRQKERLWVTSAFQAVAAGVTTANIPTPLVAPIDWTRFGGVFERGAVLQAIRGWYQVSYGASSTSTQPSWYLAITKDQVGEDFSIIDWTNASAYNSEDVLWCDGGALAISSATPAAATPWVSQSTVQLSRQLDIGSKRKLNSDEVINLSFVTPSAAQDWVISGVIRSLITVP